MAIYCYIMYADDDSLSVTAAGEELGRGCREGCSRTNLDAETETFEKDRAAV
mgnify:CR=1 FL=1